VYKKTRGKSLRIALLSSGTVEVRVPFHMTLLIAKAFMFTHMGRVKSLYEKQQGKLLALKEIFDKRLFEIHSGERLLAYKKEALCFVSSELQIITHGKSFIYKKVEIKNTSSRWGSCSSRGTLSFHYKILFLPQELQKYLLVHELCHLSEMNHGKRFWALVKEEYPEYEGAKKRLKSLPIFS